MKEGAGLKGGRVENETFDVRPFFSFSRGGSVSEKHRYGKKIKKIPNLSCNIVLFPLLFYL
jgi:hypothetical protein